MENVVEQSAGKQDRSDVETIETGRTELVDEELKLRLEELTEAAGVDGTGTPAAAAGVGGGDGNEQTDDEEEYKKIETLKLREKSLVSFPHDVLKYKHLTELDLSDNSLQRLPADIRHLKSLVRLNISRNAIRSRFPDDFTGLPRELATLPRLSVLSVSDCNLRFVPAAVWQCAQLTGLDISRNKLNVIAPDVRHLERLTRLDVRSTSIVTLPPEIVYCQQLVEVLLWGNVVQSFPDTLAYLPRLRRVAVDFRNFARQAVDDYADGLIRDGSFDSDHLPTVIFELPALELLDLGTAKINRLPTRCRCPLRELRLGHNYFRQLPQMVLDLGLLAILDVSANQLTTFPPEIGRLGSLRSLVADDNRIDRLPEEFSQLTSLEELSMSRNGLIQLPESIGSMKQLRKLNFSSNLLTCLPDSITELENLQTLDLTRNCLTSLPSELHRLTELHPPHTFRHLNKDGLWLQGNPIEDPPPHIWMTTDRKRIYDYGRRDSAEAVGERLHQTRLIVLGDIICGKTSLIGRLTGRTFRSSKTELIRFVRWSTETNAVKFLIEDVKGDDVRRAALLWPTFFDEDALYVIVYDHSRFRADSFDERIGRYLDLILVHHPQAVVQVVGTKVDRLLSKDAAKRSKDLVENFLRCRLDNLGNMSRTETGIRRKVTFSGVSLDDDYSVVGSNVRRMVHLFSSTKDEVGYRTSLVAMLESIVLDEHLFPYSRERLDCDRLSMELRNRLSGFWMTWNEVRNVAADCEIASDDLVRYLRHLHRTGQVYWTRRRLVTAVDGGILFPRQRRLVEILESTFRRNVDEFLNYDKNRPFFYSVGGYGTSDRFNVARQALLERGLASVDMLACLWADLEDDNEVEGVQSPLLELLEELDLGAAVSEQSIDDDLLRHQYPGFVPAAVLPLYSTVLRGGRKSVADSLTDAEDKDDDRSQTSQAETDDEPMSLSDDMTAVAVSFRFQLKPTAGIFERFSVHLQSELQLETRLDWKDALSATVNCEEEESSAFQLFIVDSPEGLEIQVRGTEAAGAMELMDRIKVALLELLKNTFHSQFNCEFLPNEEFKFNFDRTY